MHSALLLLINELCKLLMYSINCFHNLYKINFCENMYSDKHEGLCKKGEGITSLPKHLRCHKNNLKWLVGYSPISG